LAISRGGKMSDLIIYPAIDLRAGSVVRLAQGDPRRQTVYDGDPAAVARKWIDAGAAWLHIVNLDGAFGDTGEPNQRALETIRRAAGGRACIQFGGGLRKLADIEDALDLGVDRVVLGTAAVEHRELVAAALTRHGRERIAVGLDTRAGRVRVRGWTEEAGITPLALAQALVEDGLRIMIYTDIARDGVGTGINVAASRELAEATGLQVIASGGVASLEDIRRVREAGLAGVIVGRALYESQIDLKQALALGRGEQI
jgi:phosphoribosylformimino-5-aminoimidazole carboxamide ribotide isomerase